MRRDILSLSKTTFDLLVVGGGINGAAIANLAAAAGASVALVEKGDFASGTSSKSTKLLHGGIRYLENLEFDLVSEALKERHVQWRAAPHLVKPLPFVIPVYKNDHRPLWLMQVGVWLYDFLSGKYRIGRHRFLSVDDVLALAPGIKQEGLVGGVEYFDAQMDDARLCLENVLMADARGVKVANYVEVLDFIKEKGKVVGVRAKDLREEYAFDILAKEIIVATGPWTNQLMGKDSPTGSPLPNRVRTTKGVHIVYRGVIAQNAFLLQAKDKRVFFIIPFKGHSLIGTTDTDYDGNPNEVKVEDEDIQYLLAAAARVFPQITFDPANIITTFAGLRPLVFDKGHPSHISRKHAIEKTPAGVYYVMGGKYTTYRAIAEEVVRKVLPRLADKLPASDSYVLYGSGAVNEEFKIIAERFGVSVDVIRHLTGFYGGCFMDVLHITGRDPSLKEKICTCSPSIRAQVVYAREVEMAQTPQDAERRLNLFYTDCPTHQCRRAIEEIFNK